MPYVIAFDGGGSQTRGALFDDGQQIASVDGPSTNPIEIGVYASARRLEGMVRALLPNRDGEPITLAGGISGFGKIGDPSPYLDRLLRDDIGRLLLSDDLSPLAFANLGEASGVVVIAGTGSSVVVQQAGGSRSVFGGRGPRFGEAGSGYALALRALHAVGQALDGAGPVTTLVPALQEACGAESIDAWTRWTATASKSAIAGLAPRVIAEASRGDTVAESCVAAESAALAALVAGAMQRSGMDEGVPVLLHGGLLFQSTEYRQRVTNALTELLPRTKVDLVSVSGPDAVYATAMAPELPPGVHAFSLEDMPLLRPTERRIADGITLDSLSAAAISERMTRADARAVAAVDECRDVIAKAIVTIADALREGGRLVYVGAGTSGRIGVLDASECPPTFGTAPDDVIALIAGGDAALRTGIEGAEDNRERGAQDLDALSPAVSGTDVVVGIAASGTTPYVHAALERAKFLDAATVLVSCNPVPGAPADIVIELDTGPEVLPGSTRLKAGTATKLVLNQLTTGAMTLAGRVFEGYMVGVRPSNVKLRKRCIAILAALTELNAGDAEVLLGNAGDDIRVGVLMHRKGMDRAAAERALEAARGSLREASEQ